MKQVRFTHVVEQSGRPEVYLLLTDPKADAHFQQALKANHVMTLQHGAGGSKTSFGTVGYLPEVRGELLIFPRSLSPFADARIVGINYDLLQQEREPVDEKPSLKEKVGKQEKQKEEPEPKSKPKPEVRPSSPAPEPKVVPISKASPASPPEPETKLKTKGKRKGSSKSENQPELNLEREAPRPPAKIISFAGDEPVSLEEEEESPQIAELKKEMRRALKALEAGKQVLAFNILKKALD